jgi:hypothetical protein
LYLRLCVCLCAYVRMCVHLRAAHVRALARVACACAYVCAHVRALACVRARPQAQALCDAVRA